MKRSRTRVKLSKAQKLENDTNRWLAKKAAAIDMLVKAMGQLKLLDRSARRLQKAALNPPKPKPKAAVKEAVAAAPVEDREAHMKSLGFRPRRKRKTVAGEVAKILGESLS
jgi:hypothetical protein